MADLFKNTGLSKSDAIRAAITELGMEAGTDEIKTWLNQNYPHNQISKLDIRGVKFRLRQTVNQVTRPPVHNQLSVVILAADRVGGLVPLKKIVDALVELEQVLDIEKLPPRRTRGPKSPEH